MRPALHAPHMSAPVLVASHEAHRATVRHNAHTTATRRARRHLAATHATDKTVFRFPHATSRVHVLHATITRLTHQSTVSDMLEQHALRVLHDAQSLHIHIITKRAPTNRHTPVIPKPLGPNQATHQARRRTRINRRTHNQHTVRRTHRPHTRPRIIPRNTATITNRSGRTRASRSDRTSEPATRRSVTLSEESLTLRHRPEMRRQLTIRTHKPTRPRLRTTPHHAASSITPHANMKTSHSKTSHSTQHKKTSAPSRGCANKNRKGTPTPSAPRPRK